MKCQHIRTEGLGINAKKVPFFIDTNSYQVTGNIKVKNNGIHERVQVNEVGEMCPSCNRIYR